NWFGRYRQCNPSSFCRQLSHMGRHRAHHFRKSSRAQKRTRTFFRGQVMNSKDTSIYKNRWGIRTNEEGKLKPRHKFIRMVGAVPGALMIYPLFLGATVNTFFPEILALGSFTTDLFSEGTGTLLGLFFFCMGAQLNPRQGAL